MNHIFLILLDDNNTATCEPQYIGCYVDDPDRDLEHGPIEFYSDFTASTCNEKCKRYSFFSLQFGGYCFCGNAYATSYRYQKRPDSECGGENGLGRIWRNSVYKTCGNRN